LHNKIKTIKAVSINPCSYLKKFQNVTFVLKFDRRRQLLWHRGKISGAGENNYHEIEETLLIQEKTTIVT